jgi:hypothetical protein
MPRKQDIKDVDRIAKEGGLTPEQRQLFGDYLHDCKAHGDKGHKNARGDFDEAELLEKLKEFKDLIG